MTDGRLVAVAVGEKCRTRLNHLPFGPASLRLMIVRDVRLFDLRSVHAQVVDVHVANHDLLFWICFTAMNALILAPNTIKPKRSTSTHVRIFCLLQCMRNRLFSNSPSSEM